jgi:peptidyl-prolyl cis-trans isomerase D
MISWMQKHNKYLVWTIWVATIAFIGAGFVGWGSYDFGAKAGNVAKIGSIEIPQTKLNMVYSDLYGQVNQKMNGKLDDKKAKELGLVREAFKRINTQTKLLNFAKDLGIIVSDKEIANYLQKIKSFQKDGQFNKEIYKGFLTAKRMKANVFEEQLREEITIAKTFKLLGNEALPLEIEAISTAMNVADKIEYKVLSNADVNVTVDDAKLKAFWESKKEDYKTSKVYELAIVWTDSKDANFTEAELKPFYNKNSFKYSDSNGKQLLFEEAKERVIVDLKLKKTKKSSQKNYIAFKKGKLEATETVKLPLNDNKLSKEIWEDILTKSISDITKPKTVSDKYATVKIVSVIEPKVKSFENAKNDVVDIYKYKMQKEGLSKLADNTLKNFSQSDKMLSEFIDLDSTTSIKPLNLQESLQFTQKLFTSAKEMGIISVSDKMIVYNIIEQKVINLDKNNTELVKETVNQIKNNIFESNLIKVLDSKYSTEVYMEGLVN